MARDFAAEAQFHDRAEPVLAIRGLDVRFASPDGEVHAVRGIDVDVVAGETLAIVANRARARARR
jgi:oligopeptide transport system ATP-binding protein